MDIKYDVLEKEISTGQLRSVYLFFGDEKYLIDNLVKKIKKKFGDLVQGINYVIIDETNIGDLTFNIEVPAFGYDKKLIIVKDSGLFKKDGRKKTLTPVQMEVKNYFMQNKSIINEMAIIVFVENEVDKNDVYTAIDRVGVICNITELKTNQLILKLKGICNLYKVNCDDATLSYLLEISGTNLQVLINEIRKLIEYVGENGTITRDSVDKLATKQIESVIFELTDNLGTKNINKALEILDNLLYQKEPLPKILVTLYNHFKKLYLCNITQKLNKDIRTSLGLKPNQTFLITKYKKQASYFKIQELEQILKEFVEIDYKFKSGLIDTDIALRSVLCGCCS